MLEAWTAMRFSELLFDPAPPDEPASTMAELNVAVPSLTGHNMEHLFWVKARLNPYRADTEMDAERAREPGEQWGPCAPSSRPCGTAPPLRAWRRCASNRCPE